MDSEDRDHFKTIAAAPSLRPEGSVSAPKLASSHSGLDPDYLLSRAELMFACYRKDDATQPDTYCAAVAAVLGDGYSREVVDYVTDPRTGIPSRIKFLPSVAEVREACEARAAFVARIGRYENLRPVKPEPVPVLPGQFTYGEYLGRCKTAGVAARPLGRFETQPYQERNNVD